MGAIGELPRVATSSHTLSKIGYVLSAALAVLFTFFIHEGAHWLAGELLGNRMGMTLNAAYPLSGQYLKVWHESYISAAGPLVTLIQAVLVYLIMQRQSTNMLYPFLLTPAIMRVLALAMNFINPQDEGRISRSLGIGLFTLPLVISAFLLYLATAESRRRQYGWRFNTASVVLIITFSSILILMSQRQ